MRKLNNKGWGFVQMVILSSCIIGALLVAAYLIYLLYSSFGLA